MPHSHATVAAARQVHISIICFGTPKMAPSSTAIGRDLPHAMAGKDLPSTAPPLPDILEGESGPTHHYQLLLHARNLSLTCVVFASLLPPVLATYV